MSIDQLTQKVDNLTTTTCRNEIPPEKWSKRQIKRHRQKVNSYVLAGAPLPESLVALDLALNSVHPKNKPHDNDDNGGDGTEGSTAEGAKGTKRKYSPTGTTPKMTGKRPKGSSNSNTTKQGGTEEIADCGSESSHKTVFVVCGDPIVPMTDLQIKRVMEAVGNKINDTAEKKCEDPATMVLEISMMPSRPGIRMDMGNTESFDWLSQYLKSAPAYWQGCRLRVLGESALPRKRCVEVTFRPPVPPQSKILVVLNGLNSKLGVLGWTIVGRTVNKSSGFTYYQFELTEQELEAVKAANFRINLSGQSYILKERKTA